MVSPIVKSRPTQRDIARALGISQATVAMALNVKTQAKLTPETVALVQSKAQEMNYVPQRQASILSSGRSHTIGAVWADGTYHAPRERVRYLAQGAIGAGYQLVAIDINWFGENFKAAGDYLLGMAVEGLVFCNIRPELSAYLEEFISQYDLPAVALCCIVSGIDQANLDLEQSFFNLTEHHLAQGSRALHLLLPSHHPIESIACTGHHVYDRGVGFIQAIKAAGGEVIAEPDAGRLWGIPSRFSRGHTGLRGVLHYPLHTPLHTDAFETGFMTTHKILSATRGPKPDSLVCSNDDMAMGALHACFERRVAVPRETLISGADDTAYARHSVIPLTTMEHSSQEMSQWCIRRLVTLIENPSERLTPRQEFFTHKLVLRSSTDRSTPSSTPSLV